MRKYYIFLIFNFLIIYGKTQNNAVILTDNSKIILTGTSNIVIAQPDCNGIVRQGANKSGCFITTSEQNRLLWNIGNSAIGTYTFPFSTNDGDTIPLSLSINNAGTQTTNGQIIVSTYHTGNDNLPIPVNSDSYFSDVTNINNAENVDNSSNMIDRYWIICFGNYTTKPTVTAKFVYDAIGTNDLNGLTETNLQAQYWNGTQWMTPGAGTIGTHYISDVAGINYNAPWTLTNIYNPLPIGILSFNAECEQDKTILIWATSSESNNDYFTIERSLDAVDYTPIGTVDGAGNSNTVIYYQFTDNNYFPSDVYYRLKQTDFDGTYTYSSVLSVNCDNFYIDFAQIYPNPANEQISLEILCSENTDGWLTVYNSIGQDIMKEHIILQKGKTVYPMDISLLSSGIYSITFHNELGAYCKSKEAVLKMKNN